MCERERDTHTHTERQRECNKRSRDEDRKSERIGKKRLVESGILTSNRRRSQNDNANENVRRRLVRVGVADEIRPEAGVGRHGLSACFGPFLSKNRIAVAKYPTQTGIRT